MVKAEKFSSDTTDETTAHNIGIIEEKVYSSATIEDNFADKGAPTLPFFFCSFPQKIPPHP
jgi:hypothetical protein